MPLALLSCKPCLMSGNHLQNTHMQEALSIPPSALTPLCLSESSPDHQHQGRGSSSREHWSQAESSSHFDAGPIHFSPLWCQGEFACYRPSQSPRGSSCQQPVQVNYSSTWILSPSSSLKVINVWLLLGSYCLKPFKQQKEGLKTPLSATAAEGVCWGPGI